MRGCATTHACARARSRRRRRRGCCCRLAIPGYTDFYSSKEHATNVGSMFRDPQHALLPNWLYVPIAYNGRASSIVVSGTPVLRPNGQTKRPDAKQPVFGPMPQARLRARDGVHRRRRQRARRTGSDRLRRCKHVFGMVLLNDWSARDIQQWEYIPLGPFNSKTFATSISPWVVTMEALRAVSRRRAGPGSGAAALPRNDADRRRTTSISRRRSHPAARRRRRSRRRISAACTGASRSSSRTTRCRDAIFARGDLIGSGTISGDTPDSCGSLLELTWNGTRPLRLPDGTERTFLEDDDEVILTGWAQGKDYRVGFGEVRGRIVSARGS